MIPNKLHFTYKTPEIPELYLENIDKWRRQCPNWEFHYYSNAAVFAFFEEYFPQYVSDTKKIPKGVALADIFRYAVLFVYGGLYADMDTYPVQPLPKKWHQRQAVIGYEFRPSKYPCKSIIFPPKDSFCQWVLLGERGHPIYGKAVKKGIENLRASNFVLKSTQDVFKQTGPLHFTSIVEEHLQDPTVLILDMDTFYSVNLESRDPVRSPYIIHENHGLSRWTAEKWLPHLKIE